MSGMNCYDCHELEQELKLALLHLDIANAAVDTAYEDGYINGQRDMNREWRDNKDEGVDND